MGKYTAVVLLLLLTGCKVTLTPKSLPGYGAARERLFVQCMQLAKDTVQAGHYNDSAEVISECNRVSRYQANSYRRDGYRGQTTESENE